MPVITEIPAMVGDSEQKKKEVKDLPEAATATKANSAEADLEDCDGEHEENDLSCPDKLELHCDNHHPDNTGEDFGHPDESDSSTDDDSEEEKIPAPPIPSRLTRKTPKNIKARGSWVRVAPTRRFNPGICNNCLRLPSCCVTMKRCSQCRLVNYCSKTCFRQDWPKHKDLCEISIPENGKSVFSGAGETVKNEKDWWSFRKELITKTSFKLGRELQLYEKEILTFPRVCVVCKEDDPAKLKGCDDCYSAWYCAKDHFKDDEWNHAETCDEYFLALRCEIFLSKKGIPFPKRFPYPSLITPVTDNFIPLPKDMGVLVKPKVDENLQTSRAMNVIPVLQVILSNRLSYPLSILYALEQIKLIDKNISEVKEMTIHIVGDEFTESTVIGNNCWEYLFHRLPQLRKLHLVFVKPRLNTDMGFNRLCPYCLSVKREIIYDLHDLSYHDYAESPKYVQPDIVIVYDAGFYIDDSWKISLDKILSIPQVPFIFTSLRKPDSEKNLEAIKSCKSIETLLPMMKNPFKGLQPFRHMYGGEDGQLYYSNYYIGVVRSS